MNLFKLPWILIDFIIIFMLFIVLISIKLYKENTRWRRSISNSYLEVIEIPSRDLNTPLNQFSIEHMKLIKNCNSVLSDEKPLLIIPINRIYAELIGIITEGLASYGYEVLTVKKKGTNSLSLSQLINDINNILKTTYSCYITISFEYFPLSFPYTSLFNDEHNKGMILINPQPKKIDFASFMTNVPPQTIQKKLGVIYNKYYFYLIRNQRLLKFRKKILHIDYLQHSVIILEKARCEFKNYETLLLGVIINFIEERHNKN
ncbi:MAG: hypothetical protein BAJALOKI1v1_330007 [Promethearchaeota archaeon]|nr:MAG: hypothetical protein BAJALOKI1v1_330007 [Candidatus Lokiarchaeota archaeon]